METRQSWPTPLSELLASKETQSVEFKASMATMREGFEQLCAMVNADTARGAVVFGVGPDRAIVGIAGNLDSLQGTLENHAKQRFAPPLRIEIHAEEHGGRWLLALYGRRLPRIPFHEYGGRAFVREGSRSWPPHGWRRWTAL
jgi:predicted HTH transcriptional regulator